MDGDKHKVKKTTERLSERVDALEVALLMLLNSIRNVKSFEVDGDRYNVIGQIPEQTLTMVENIIIKKNNKE